MMINGTHWRTISVAEDGMTVRIIDQTELPHRFVVRSLVTVAEAEEAIRTMRVRGAPLIGITAAYGVAFALRDDPSPAGLNRAYDALLATRPTAVNLRWALDRMMERLADVPLSQRVAIAYEEAGRLADADAKDCEAIGRHALPLIEKARHKDLHKPVNILTHCNAGWLACVDWGTALSPIYQAHDRGWPIHVWVDETRPRNQGASLTAWELQQHGIPHTVIVDNAGGHLMQHGHVDLCLVGSDRTTATGDVCNKIGTYLKALAAYDNGVPFYVTLPSSTIDFTLENGLREIPIEERNAYEVQWLRGRDADGAVRSVCLMPEGSTAANPAFDVTPARLVTALVTERGVCAASRSGLQQLFGDG